MRYRSFRSSIRYKLGVFLMAAILLPIAASILISYFYTKHSLKDDAIRENSNTIRQGTTSLIGQLNGMNNISLYAYNNIRMTNSLYNILVQGRSDFMIENNIYSGLHAIEQSAKDIQQVYLYSDLADQSWLLIDGYLKRGLGGEGLMGHFIQPLDKNDPFLEPPHPSHNYGMEEFPYSPSNTVFTIHRPVYRAPLKERIGVLSVDFKLDGFRSILNMLYDKGEENIYLLDDTGTAIYTSREEEIGTKPDYAWLRHARYSFAGAGYFDWSGDDGFNGIVVFEKFELIGRIWIVAKQIPDSYLYNNASSVLRINLLVLLTFLFIAIAAALFVSVMVTAPIKRLTESIRKIKLGKLQFDGLERSDEVGVLGSAIKNMVDTIDNLIMRELRLELANKDNQLKALQAQINPHFIFNTLQSIGSVALHHKVPRIYELTSSLGLMMRYNMNTDEPVVPLSKEIAHVQAYLELQQQRFKDRLRYSIEIVGDPDLSTSIPKMILQPIVENCFKHGFESAEQAVISISVADGGGILGITVTDNGPGVSPERLQELQRRIAHGNPGGTEGGSIGLINVISRLRLFYNDKAAVTIGHAKPCGFSVHLGIPLTEGAVHHESADSG